MGVLTSIKNIFGDGKAVVIDGNDEEAVRQWLLQRMAKHLKRDVNELNSSKSFEQYGLDSLFAVQVTGELEKAVEMRLSPALLFENTCINDVAKVIATTATTTATAS